MILTEEKNEMICKNLKRDEGELLFAGMSVSALAKKHGTPLYLYDEDRIREKCRAYLDAVKEGFGGSAEVLYASKAASTASFSVCKPCVTSITFAPRIFIRATLGACFLMSTEPI